MTHLLAKRVVLLLKMLETSVYISCLLAVESRAQKLFLELTRECEKLGVLSLKQCKLFIVNGDSMGVLLIPASFTLELKCNAL